MIALFAAVASAEPVPPAPGSPHHDLEVLYHEHRFEEGLKATKEGLVKDPEDTDLYWHVVRFMYEIGELHPRDDKDFDKAAWYTEMRQYAETGLAKKPGDPHLSFAVGIAYARYGTTKGVMSTLALADDVENAWRLTADAGYEYRSIGDEELLPCDVYMSLGVFYRLVPDSWLVEKVSGTRGSLTQSIAYLEKSDQCAPNRMATLKELGVARICQSQHTKDDALFRSGLQTLGRAMAVRPEDSTDFTDLKHIARLMADPDQACGYSRDGQQDLDESQAGQPGPGTNAPGQ